MKRKFSSKHPKPGKELTKLLNLNYTKFSNRTKSVGENDFPELICKTKVYPDYLALYSETSKYHETDFTCVCFYQYDDEFDGKDGLFNAIYYSVEERLKYFKKRFEGVRFVITPDQSELGDVHRIENDYRIFKSRIIGLWFVFEIGACVIPNITYPTTDDIERCLCGLEKCKVVAISTKGHMNSKKKRLKQKEEIDLITDYLSLDTLIVYDVCGDSRLTQEVIEPAIRKGIRVVIPPNSLRLSNQAKNGGGEHA